MPENQGLDTHIDDITNLDIFQFLPHVVVGGFFFAQEVIEVTVGC